MRIAYIANVFVVEQIKTLRRHKIHNTDLAFTSSVVWSVNV